jgi:hypothetical protein
MPAAANAICAFTALFIVGMVWLRTAMHYAKTAGARRSLTAAGVIYFAVLGLVLVSGWFAAPHVARALAPSAPVAPTLARVVWFLAAYYLFIPVHLILKARGAAVFRAADSPERGMA